jgi:hypothetical protein
MDEAGATDRWASFRSLQRRTLIDVGEAIKQSFQPGRTAVRAVEIQGHADYDAPRNLQRERQVSVEWAEAAATWGLGANSAQKPRSSVHA